jgi:hypothetical protein
LSRIRVSWARVTVFVAALMSVPPCGGRRDG